MAPKVVGLLLVVSINTRSILFVFSTFFMKNLLSTTHTHTHTQTKWFSLNSFFKYSKLITVTTMSTLLVTTLIGTLAVQTPLMAVAQTVVDDPATNMQNSQYVSVDLDKAEGLDKAMLLAKEINSNSAIFLKAKTIFENTDVDIPFKVSSNATDLEIKQSYLKAKDDILQSILDLQNNKIDNTTTNSLPSEYKNQVLETQNILKTQITPEELKSEIATNKEDQKLIEQNSQDKKILISTVSVATDVFSLTIKNLDNNSKITKITKPKNSQKIKSNTEKQTSKNTKKTISQNKKDGKVKSQDGNLAQPQSTINIKDNITTLTKIKATNQEIQAVVKQKNEEDKQTRLKAKKLTEAKQHKLDKAKLGGDKPNDKAKPLSTNGKSSVAGSELPTTDSDGLNINTFLEPTQPNPLEKILSSTANFLGGVFGKGLSASAFSPEIYSTRVQGVANNSVYWEVPYGDTTNGRYQLNQTSYANNWWQNTWYLLNDDTIRVGGKCMTLSQANIVNRQPIILYDCNGGWNQKWEWAGNNTIKLKNTSYCIDADSQNLNQKLYLYQCGSWTERWQTSGGTSPSTDIYEARLYSKDGFPYQAEAGHTFLAIYKNNIPVNTFGIWNTIDYNQSSVSDSSNGSGGNNIQTNSSIIVDHNGDFYDARNDTQNSKFKYAKLTISKQQADNVRFNSGWNNNYFTNFNQAFSDTLDRMYYSNRTAYNIAVTSWNILNFTQQGRLDRFSWLLDAVNYATSGFDPNYTYNVVDANCSSYAFWLWTQMGGVSFNIYWFGVATPATIYRSGVLNYQK